MSIQSLWYEKKCGYVRKDFYYYNRFSGKKKKEGTYSKESTWNDFTILLILKCTMDKNGIGGETLINLPILTTVLCPNPYCRNDAISLYCQ